MPENQDFDLRVQVNGAESVGVNFDQSFYVLCCLGYWILATDALAPSGGREKVKEVFRSGMLAAGSYEELCALPEFQAAMRDCQGLDFGDPPMLTADEAEAERQIDAGEPQNGNF
jgi:hypothetical protein